MKDISIFHDSHQEYFRSPFGAAACTEKLTLRLKVEDGKQIDAVMLRLITEGGLEQEVSMHLVNEGEGACFYEVMFTAPEKPGLLWYFFVVVINGQSVYYGNNQNNLGGIGSMYDHLPPSYQITVYKKTTTPNWFKEAIIYQIFVDRFYNGCEAGMALSPKKNSVLHLSWDDDPLYITDSKTGKIVRWDFFGGNLIGVGKKLPYLKSLGINVIYFNPIFEAASNHKYDTGNYHKIDAMFGNNEIFESFCTEAKELGISVIIDGVFSHTGSDSIYFNKEGTYEALGAYQSSNSPYYAWYSFSEFPNKYDCWWGIDTLPNVKEMEPAYQDFVIYGEKSVLNFWHGKGIKGWRLDVADELPDQFMKNFYGMMKELDKDSVLIGEVWEDASNKVSYGKRREYLLGEEADSVMNYPFREIVLSFVTGKKEAAFSAAALMNLYENYPRQHFYSTMNLVGSHDVARVLSVVKENLPENLSEGQIREVSIERLKLTVLWQMTFPGVPSIYYGDEAGVEGGKDPLNRKTYPWGKENNDLLSFFKNMTAIRNHYDVLKTGLWMPFYTQGDVFSFLRIIENDTDVFGQSKKDNVALILLNRSSAQEADLSLDVSPWCSAMMIDILDDYKEIAVENGILKINIHPLQGKILLKDRWGSNLKDKRECGILLHPTSLPSKYGVGDIGREAYKFVDFLAESQQKIWQILPLNPPGYGESPYQCLSSFAGNPLLIDAEDLLEEGLLKEEDLRNIPDFESGTVEFSKVRNFKEKIFYKAFQSYKAMPNNSAYEAFTGANSSWLDDYALFISLKKYFKGASWNTWDDDIAHREENALSFYRNLLKEEIEFNKFIQFQFFRQWKRLKAYANSRGIKIIGDIPIFVSHDSSDVWVSPHLFMLDKSNNPAKVAGVPPDYFSATGQRWGNPIYNWSAMEKDDYLWWRKRFAYLFEMVDSVRIDHFRGFEQYWEIQAEEKTAVNGKWVQGPGSKFFSTVKKYLGNMPVIVEDLGFITPAVEDLKVQFNFPGMKVLQFEMEGRGFKLPLNEKKTLVYTGTHDNDTILGWYKKNYQVEGNSSVNERDICWSFIETVYRSDAETVILPLQDVLCLDSNARMNTPGTEQGNWKWRFSQSGLTKELEDCLKNLVKNYRR